MAVSQASAPRTFPLDGRFRPGPGSQANDRITDRTAWPRLGLRGPGVPDWCAQNGLALPSRINRCERLKDGRMARLGRTEILILPDAGAGSLPEIGAAAGVYDAFRQETWAWFRIEGPGTGSALAQLSSADFRPSQVCDGDVTQSRLAGLDAVFVAVGDADDRAFDILLDIASSDFLAELFAERCLDFLLCNA